MEKIKTENKGLGGVSVPNIFIFLAIIAIACSVILYAISLTKKYQLSSTEKKLTDVQNELRGKSEIDSDAKVAAAAVENYDSLASGINHWSEFLQKISSNTLINSKLTELSMQQDSGVLNVEGIVRSYEDLSKFIVALRGSEAIEKVTLVSANLDTSVNVAGIGFVLEVTPSGSALAPAETEQNFEQPSE
jgi:Tfp pilus assembly protein PilN